MKSDTRKSELPLALELYEIGMKKVHGQCVWKCIWICQGESPQRRLRIRVTIFKNQKSLPFELRGREIFTTLLIVRANQEAEKRARYSIFEDSSLIQIPCGRSTELHLTCERDWE